MQRYRPATRGEILHVSPLMYVSMFGHTFGHMDGLTFGHMVGHTFGHKVGHTLDTCSDIWVHMIGRLRRCHARVHTSYPSSKILDLSVIHTCVKVTYRGVGELIRNTLTFHDGP